MPKSNMFSSFLQYQTVLLPGPKAQSAPYPNSSIIIISASTGVGLNYQFMG